MVGKRANNEGTIYKRKRKRKDGSSKTEWVGAITLKDSKTGEPKRKVIYGASQSEVREKLDSLTALRDKGGAIQTTEKLTLGEYLKLWLTETKPRVKPDTYRRYEQFCRLYLIPDLGHIRLTQLTRQQVNNYLNSLRGESSKGVKNRIIAPRSLHHLRSILRSALNSAIKNDLILRNPAALFDPVKVPVCEYKPLTVEESENLLQALKGERLYPLFALALLTGMRNGELLALRWECIDLEARVVKVEKTLKRVDGRYLLAEPKSATSRRVFRLPASLVPVLYSWKARQLEERLRLGEVWENEYTQWGLVFTTPTGLPNHPTNALHEFHAALKRAGLEKMRLHDLRHSYATLMMANGADGFEVMKQLGHSTIALTLNTYSHATEQLRKRTADRIDSLLGSAIGEG